MALRLVSKVIKVLVILEIGHQDPAEDNQVQTVGHRGLLAYEILTDNIKTLDL